MWRSMNSAMRSRSSRTLGDGSKSIADLLDCGGGHATSARAPSPDSRSPQPQRLERRAAPREGVAHATHLQHDLARAPARQVPEELQRQRADQEAGELRALRRARVAAPGEAPGPGR